MTWQQFMIAHPTVETFHVKLSEIEPEQAKGILQECEYLEGFLWCINILNFKETNLDKERLKRSMGKSPERELL